jgi:UDP-N-acetylmuramoylalanine--D-glutamate ligase
MKSLVNTSVLVLGLGTSGLAMVRWCVRHGASVTVWDDRPVVANDAVLTDQLPMVKRLVGAFNGQVLQAQTFNKVFTSPGLSPEALAPLVESAKALAIPVEGELTLFNEALQTLAQTQDYKPIVLAITGTNGKTTVTSLTTQLLKRAGVHATMAGNIGPSLLDTLGQAMDAGALPEVWVLELSSFQLVSCKAFNPFSATVLNVTQDHLDWHGSMAAYLAAKLSIFGPDTHRVIHRDDSDLASQCAPVPAPVAKGKRAAEKSSVTFGWSVPTQAGDFGVESVNGLDWLVKAQNPDGGTAPRRVKKEAREPVTLQRLMPVEALRIRGRHNALNAMAALALAQSTGAALSPMLYGLREYRGEPHRVESIGLLAEVEYFDDSKGTNVGATVAAIEGLGRDRALVLILGGEGKGQDFSPLAEPVKKYASAVVLIGRDAPGLEQVLRPTGVCIVHANSMEQALDLASEKAKAGDAVLLSPACASFDMFKSYVHRGQVFRQAFAARAADVHQQVMYV